MKKKIALFGIWCAILMCISFTLYSLSPDVKKSVDYTIVSYKIEKQLQDKYGIPFEVKAKWIAEGNQLYQYPVRYPKQEAAYTFGAEFGDDSSEEAVNYISGIVDYNIDIIADSYAYYRYEDNMLQRLSDTVAEEMAAENILVLSFMNADHVLTLSKDADNWEAFWANTKTYEPMCLLINEEGSENQMQSVKSILAESKFPFSVLIAEATAEEIEVLRQNNIKSLLYEYDRVIDLMDELYKGNGYPYLWIDDLEEYGEYYLWYQETEETIYNADVFDKISKGVE